jgi:hypothetical protein
LSVSFLSFKYLDSGIGAHEGAGFASGALVFAVPGKLRGEITHPVMLVGNLYQLLRAELYAEIASLASVPVYLDIGHVRIDPF